MSARRQFDQIRWYDAGDYNFKKAVKIVPFSAPKISQEGFFYFLVFNIIFHLNFIKPSLTAATVYVVFIKFSDKETQL